MTATWEYRRGNWARIADPTRGKEGNILSDILHGMGFLPEITLGEEFSHFSVEVYTHNEGNAEGYEYVVFPLTNSCLVDTVYIPDLPSYLMFMREMAPLIQLTYLEKGEE